MSFHDAILLLLDVAAYRCLLTPCHYFSDAIITPMLMLILLRATADTLIDAAIDTPCRCLLLFRRRHAVIMMTSLLYFAVIDADATLRRHCFTRYDLHADAAYRCRHEYRAAIMPLCF